MPETVQILKESKARFEGVIFKQEADLGTEKSTSCKVIDEATGNVIAESGSGGGGESDFTTANVTIAYSGYEQYAPAIDAPAYMDSEQFTGAYSVIGEAGNYTVILYKEKAMAVVQAIPSTFTVAVTGDATTEEGTGIIEITGDCTITITKVTIG